MFDYIANMTMEKNPNKQKQTNNNKQITGNTLRNFLLFMCIPGKQAQGKRGSTFIIHSVFHRCHGAPDGNKKHMGCFGTRLLSMRFLMAGGWCLYFKQAPRCRVGLREGAPGLLAPTESPHSSPPTSAQQQLLWGVFQRGFPKKAC